MFINTLYRHGDIIKKSFSPSTIDTIQFIERMRNQYYINILCEILSISRDTFYKI